MNAALDQLDRFHRFAKQKLQDASAETLEELLDLWRIENPTDEVQEDIHAAIHHGLDDIEAGRGRDADEALEELRLKHNLTSR